MLPLLHQQFAHSNACLFYQLCFQHALLLLRVVFLFGCMFFLQLGYLLAWPQEWRLRLDVRLGVMILCQICRTHPFSELLY